jgi:hypothetical protein
MENDYHKERFDIVKTCLQSMRDRCYKDHTFYVWDNGSCEVFRDWVYNEFKPDLLTLSHNIGKISARTAAITALPLSSLVCYSDDDMLFYDNWLQPQLEILNYFPNVALVSGYAIRTSFRWGYKKMLEWARKNAKLETGHFIPDEYEKDFAESVGRDPEQHLIETAKDQDVIIEYQEMKAYATGHHCQFIAYAGKILPVMISDAGAMTSEQQWDNAVDQLGLRLSTLERYCRHMGNHVDDKLRIEMDEVWNKEKEKVAP